MAIIMNNDINWTSGGGTFSSVGGGENAFAQNAGASPMSPFEFSITQLSTNYKLQLAMPPENVSIKYTQSFRTFNIIHLGEIKQPRGEKLTGISWSGILPGRKMTAYSFVNSSAWQEPIEIAKIIDGWKFNHWEQNTSKLHLLITQTAINLDVYLEHFNYKHVGGLGNIEYQISFFAAKDLTIQTVEEVDGNKLRTPDTTSKNGAYTVKSGDSLWAIAQDKLGDGSRWPEIHELNKDKIKNPDLIYPGQELQLPEK